MKPNAHLVSVIIPNFNRGDYLKQALQSVVYQTYPYWEALVVDDGSTDGSKEEVCQIVNNEQRIKWMDRNRTPKGAATCRNMGIEQAQGEFIVFLDSDDLLAPHCLEQRLQIMQSHPDLDFAVFKMQFFKEQPGDDPRLWNLENETKPLQRFLNLDSVWQTSGPIWKASAVKKLDGFNEKLQCWQDFDIHLKALLANLNYDIRYDLPIDSYYRKEAKETISQSNMNSLPKLKSKAELYNWVKPLAQKQGCQTDNMLHQILISALNGHQIQFFDDLYQQEKQSIPSHVKRKLNSLKWIKKSRLDRLAYFKKNYQQLVQSCVQESSIGQFKEI